MPTENSATTMTATVMTSGREKKVRSATVTCAWCRQEVAVPVKGRVPKWCGTSCRHRAWEQTRAAASGRSAVDVVERVVTVQLPRAATAVPSSRATGAAGGASRERLGAAAGRVGPPAGRRPHLQPRPRRDHPGVQRGAAGIESPTDSLIPPP